MSLKRFRALLFAGALSAVPILGNAQEVREPSEPRRRVMMDRISDGWDYLG
jgi:hypothetical protein